MTTSTRYFEKPQPVKACQFLHDYVIIEFLQEFVPTLVSGAEFTEEGKPFTLERGDLSLTPEPDRHGKLVLNTGSEITMDYREWLVVYPDGEIEVYSNEAFEQEFFGITTKTETIMPSLTELIDG